MSPAREDASSISAAERLRHMAMRVGRIGAWSVDFPGGKVSISEEACAILECGAGLCPDLGQAIALCAPDDLPAARLAFERCLREGVPFDLELEGVTGSGRRVRVRAIGEAERDASGAVCRVQGALQAVPEVRRATRHSAHDERLARALDSMSDALVTLDREWRITYANREAERALRRGRLDLLGTGLWELFPDAMGSTFQQECERAMAGGGAAFFESRYAPLDAWFKVRAYPDEHGLAVYFRDVTASHVARERERDLLALLHGAGDAILMLDPDERVSFWNRSAERIFGRSSAEAMGRTLEALGIARLAPQGLERLLAKGEWRGETRHAGPEGRALVLESRWNVLHDRSGAVRALLAVYTDVTSQRRAQREVERLNANLEQRVRERTAELQAANAELEAFSYSVSHDLRAPLCRIEGFAAHLDECGEECSPEERARYHGIIRRSAREMDQLIGDLLDLARFSRWDLNRLPVDMGLLVREVLQGLPLQGHELRVGALPPCEGDRALLRQVWVNLLSNAVKYSSCAESPVVEVGCESVGGEDVYYVRDNGAGFDMQQAQKLFTPFGRLHRDKKYPGTGVGLALCRRIVERHGGRIWGVGSEGRGATFRFTLRAPLTAPQEYSGPNLPDS